MTASKTRPIAALGVALALLLASFLTSADAGKRPAKPKFKPAVAYPAGFDPISIASADFDADGRTDLATTNFAASGGSKSLTVLRGTGKGRFAPAAAVPSPVQSDGVVAATLPGDADPDLVVAGYSGGQIDIYRGGPGATFAPPETIPLTGGVTRYPAVGDFDSDAVPDIAVGLSDDSRVAVLFGLPNGDYEQPLLLPADKPGAFIGRVVAADLNGDDAADLLVTRDSGVVLTYLSNGNGTFAAPIPRPVGRTLLNIAVGNVDGNGKPDLIVSRGVGGDIFRTGRGLNVEEDEVMVFRGNGAGKFRLAFRRSVLSPGAVMSALAVADLDRDGRDDVVGGFQRSSQMAVLRGRKKGRLTAPKFVLTTDPSLAATVGRFNKDKRLDIALAGDREDGPAGHVDVLLQKKRKRK